MQIEETVRNGIGIISPAGNLVLEESTEFKTRIKPYLIDEKYTGLICNLEGVYNIDSSGLRMIVSIFKSMKSADKRFALSGLNDNVRELFNISKLDKLLIITPDSESALKVLDG